MSHPTRVIHFSLIAASVLAAACAGPVAQPTNIAACQTKENCEAGSRCIDGACIANSPPVADFTVSGELVTGSLVTLDASASSDQDDSVQSYSWTISTTDAQCAAPTVASKSKTVSVQFLCAGHYTVSLTVTDEMAAESAPKTQTLAVTGAPQALIQAGPPQTFGHHCSGTPLVCWPESSQNPGTPATIELDATVSSSSSYQRVRWFAVPPTGAVASVDWHGGEATLTPTVSLQANGTAIAGDWDFRVELLDNGGAIVGTAHTLVHVTNRAPVINGPTGGLPVNHLYDASSSPWYTADGSVSVTITDPDNDPVLPPQFTAHHVGDGSATFAITPSGNSVSFHVGASVPAELIGPGVVRTIVVDASDVNGERASATFTVTVGNRPPTSPSASAISVSHSYDIGTQQYVATPSVGTWTDPDGDPVAFEVRDPVCSVFRSSGGTLVLSCSSAGPLKDFIGLHAVSVMASDPWATAAPSATAFTILNRPPVIRTVFDAIGCGCGGSGGTSQICNWSGYDGPVPAVVSDADGDPLHIVTSSPVVTSSPTAFDCTMTVSGSSNDCSFRVAVPSGNGSSCDASGASIPLTASDGVRTVSGTLRIN